jgi:hypothetical protein
MTNPFIPKAPLWKRIWFLFFWDMAVWDIREWVGYRNRERLTG